MNPISIKLKNFCSIPAVEINLAGISLASIVGANGFGKSTCFAFAPLFALFGKPRPGLGLDDMVRTGTTDMSVQFDFEHNGEIYQVMRTRSTKGQGKSTAELQKKTPTGWQSLSGTKKGETDKLIEQLLSLDANTFLASCLILQGQADQFCKALPSDRKKILTSILGLSLYDILQEQAKIKAKALELKLAGSKHLKEQLEEKYRKLLDVGGHIENQVFDRNPIDIFLDVVNGELSEVKQAIGLKILDVNQKESELTETQNRIKNIEARILEAKQIQQQIDVIAEDIIAKQKETVTLSNRISDAEETLKSEPELVSKTEQLKSLRQQIPALEAKTERLKELRIELGKLETEIEKLYADYDVIIEKMGQTQKELALRDELKLASEQYQLSLVELKEQDDKSAKWHELQQQIITIQKEVEIIKEPLRGLEFHLKIHQSELEANENKIAILQNSGCPNPDIATCKFLLDAMKAKQMIPTLEFKIQFNQEQIGQIEAKLVPLTDRTADLEAEQNALDYQTRIHVIVKNKVDALRLKAEQYTSLSGKEELLQNLNEQREGLTKRITENQDNQNKINEQINDLSYWLGTLSAIREQIKQLEPCEKQLTEMPQAKAVIETTKEQIGKLESEIEAQTDKQFGLFAQIILFDKFPQQLSEAQNKQSTIQSELKELQQSMNVSFASQGFLQSRHNSLTTDKQKHAELSAQIAPMAKELTRWETLVRAFGKNGIPVLILENALPELERIANDILAEMSGGAHSLQFITQRDAKSKDSQIETLDILIRDWAGTRPFESFSGGEQTRISLAIRFALSELLANRAGSKVEFIVGDEILSDQSPEFRDMTIEAIKSMAGRFKKILVISHIPEVQAAFDQQIVISEGGKIEVNFN